ncbi:CRISPR-associated endonuclease Cas3'' [Coxiella burnetii]|uniref:CRISPR-associated endonuclease Cas3'' n=1 Tax=Coxiella burnetii TaxID=777 RepID=UPI0002F0362B|nr:CRISPR-associated endonuclease Cas3'' [Coxiella burnetii]
MYAHTENDWTYLPLIKALVAIAALLHDWGKASQLFQEKLNPKNKVGFKGDPIRHEWVSCLLLNALIQIHQDNSDQMDDRGWIEALISGHIDEAKIKALTIKQKIKPLADLPPIAKFVAWLIVSHHRLPLNKDADMRAEYCPEIDDVLNRITQRWGYENNYDELDYQQRVEQCFNFPNGLLSNSKSWMKQIQKWS